MKAYLVEGYSPEVKFDKDSVVIALTPTVCYQLDKAGIKYSIIKDYYDETELSDYMEEHEAKLLRWIDKLDEFLQANVKEVREANLNLGTIYYSHLRTTILDPTYVQYYTLQKFLEAENPSSITIISPKLPDSIPLDYTMRDIGGGRSYYSEILPLLCAQNNIPLETILLDSNSTKMKTISYEKPIARIKRALGRNNTTRKIYDRMQFARSYFKRYPTPRQRSQRKLNILLLKLAHIEADFVADALKRGHRVYLLSGDSIVKYPLLKKVRTLNIASIQWKDTARLLESSDLIKWIKDESQLDISGVILPRLKHFVSKVCPEILEYRKLFLEFYQEAQIDFVVTPHELSPIEFAAVTATSYNNRIKSVCVQHGDDIFLTKFWKSIELLHFDILISSTTETKGYYKQLKQELNSRTQIYGSKHKMLHISKMRRAREKGNTIIKDRIIYLPTLFRGNWRRLEAANYPDVWYYGFQKSLMEYFAAKKDYTFVWKGLPISDRSYNPTPDFIRDSNFDNVEIATNPFVEHILSADRVICDYPSTGFYESIIAGIPTLCLYYRSFRVRESAIEYFGKILKVFSDTSEAIAHINEFLDSDPELYKTTIDMEDNSILDILEGIGAGETSD